MRRTIFLLAILALCLAGCYDMKLTEEKSATELMADGQKKFEDRDYRSAITAFRRVTDWYPFSEHVPDAELKIAEAYFKLRQYDQAAATYEEFSNLHPRNPSTPYALYQVGRCFFDRMHTIDRDQENAEKALLAFKRFLNRYPDSEYADTARAHMKECQKRITAHELLVAKYYFKKKNYKAALIRFQRILEDYPDTGVQHIALQYLAECEAFMEAEATTIEQ
jgi:outer membrane protein assembly factor BamD